MGERLRRRLAGGYIASMGRPIQPRPGAGLADEVRTYQCDAWKTLLEVKNFLATNSRVLDGRMLGFGVLFPKANTTYTLLSPTYEI
jgi:hypothetical protein